MLVGVLDVHDLSEGYVGVVLVPDFFAGVEV